MSSSETLSVVLSVRDGAASIVGRVHRAWRTLGALTDRPTEMIVVDDGSRDATPEILARLAERHAPLRVARHDRPRGREAAGQTGLERATGNLVFVQESEADLRPADLQRLLAISEDPSVVAARAESAPRQVAPALRRRLQAWRVDLSGEPSRQHDRGESLRTSVQMIRRPALQRLAAPGGDRYRLHSETLLASTLEPVGAGFSAT